MATRYMFVFVYMQVSKLPPPYDVSRCLDTDSAHFKNPLKYFANYSEDSCRLDCYMNYIVNVKRCNCKPFYFTGNCNISV